MDIVKMKLRDLKNILNVCNVSKSTKNTFYIHYPLNTKDEEAGLNELIQYVESNVPNVDIINTYIRRINYYKGTGIKNQSHYKLEIKID